MSPMRAAKVMERLFGRRELEGAPTVTLHVASLGRSYSMPCRPRPGPDNNCRIFCLGVRPVLLKSAALHFKSKEPVHGTSAEVHAHGHGSNLVL